MEAGSSEDLYSDNTPNAPAAEAPEQKPDEASETALVPKSFFGGKDLTPGRECKIRIEQVMEDQVAVSYVPHESSEGGEMPGDEEMSQYMS
jgi:hypothetical protein